MSTKNISEILSISSTKITENIKITDIDKCDNKQCRLRGMCDVLIGWYGGGKKIKYFICKKCRRFVCQYSTNINQNKCTLCSNDNVDNLCEFPRNYFMCWYCGKILMACRVRCEYHTKSICYGTEKILSCLDCQKNEYMIF